MALGSDLNLGPFAPGSVGVTARFRQLAVVRRLGPGPGLGLIGCRAIPDRLIDASSPIVRPTLPLLTLAEGRGGEQGFHPPGVASSPERQTVQEGKIGRGIIPPVGASVTPVVQGGELRPVLSHAGLCQQCLIGHVHGIAGVGLAVALMVFPPVLNIAPYSSSRAIWRVATAEGEFSIFLPVTVRYREYS